MFSCPFFVFVPVFFLGSREKERDLEKKKIFTFFIYNSLSFSLSLLFSFFFSRNPSFRSVPSHLRDRKPKKTNERCQQRKKKQKQENIAHDGTISLFHRHFSFIFRQSTFFPSYSSLKSFSPSIYIIFL